MDTSNTQTLLSDLPPLPEPPAGHRWVYRGTGWENNYQPAKYIHLVIGCQKWSDYNLAKGDVPNGHENIHYAELVPAEKPKSEPDYFSKEHRLECFKARMDGQELECQTKGPCEWTQWGDCSGSRLHENATDIRYRIKAKTEVKRVALKGGYFHVRLYEDGFLFENDRGNRESPEFLRLEDIEIIANFLKEAK